MCRHKPSGDELSVGSRAVDARGGAGRPCLGDGLDHPPSSIVLGPGWWPSGVGFLDSRDAVGSTGFTQAESRARSGTLIGRSVLTRLARCPESALRRRWVAATAKLRADTRRVHTRPPAPRFQARHACCEECDRTECGAVLAQADERRHSDVQSACADFIVRTTAWILDRDGSAKWSSEPICRSPCGAP